MRGVFIQKPLEFRLEVPIEFATQGDTVPVSLTVKNHGSESVALSALSLELALGNLKKVKAKADDAFEELVQSELDQTSVISPGSESSFSWSFALDRNSPISDKNQAPYFLYGNSVVRSHIGQLPLTVTMPGAVPVPPSQAAAATERFDPTASEPLRTSPPTFTVVAPV